MAQAASKATILQHETYQKIKPKFFKGQNPPNRSNHYLTYDGRDSNTCVTPGHKYTSKVLSKP